ncbi:MAG: DUF4097 family beta strand repeat protein [Chloroflexi bacterium]|nr:DUF4097 family beta strand repeat protein [Chloroflexota bacterium]
MAEDVFDCQFTVDPGAELEINNLAGRVGVRAGEGGTIRLHAVKHGRRHAVENTRVETYQDGNRVRIETRGETGGLRDVSRGICAVDYDVSAPPDCELRVQTVSADVGMEGLSAAVQVKTVSGDIQLGNISGECSVTTVSGDVAGRGVRGGLSLRTTSGDARLMESQLTRFTLNTVSGDFRVETALIPGQQYEATAVSGDLLLLVPDGTGAAFQLQTVSGELRSELPAEIVKASRRHWHARINGGGADVEMSSVSGDLRVGRSPQTLQAAPSAPSDAHSQPPNVSYPVSATSSGDDEAATAGSQSEQTVVLEALERGEISVEEALTKLEGP